MNAAQHGLCRCLVGALLVLVASAAQAQGLDSGQASVAQDADATQGTLDSVRSVQRPRATTKRHSAEYARINAQLENLLTDYRFCHDADYQIPFDENGLCEFADAAKARCPGIEKACRNPFASDEASWNLSLDWLDMELLGQIFRIVVWLLVFATLGAVAYAVLRRLVNREADALPEASESSDADLAEPAPTSIPPETDVEKLLRNARDAAQKGDFRSGIAYGYHALLRHLDQKGLIEIHRSKTNGDYRRNLAEEPATQVEFTHIARTVERIQFGSASPDETTFRSVFERITRLVSQGQALLVLLALGLSTLGCDQLRQRRPSSLGCGETPGGYSVLCEMLAQEGMSVRRRIHKIAEVDAKVTTIIVLDNATIDDEEWDYLDTWASQGHTLVLTQVPSPLAKRLDVRRAEQSCSTPATLATSLKEYYGHDAELRSPTEGALSENAASSWTLAECDAGPTLLGVQHGDGTVLVLPNSRLLTNLSLASADNAWLLTKLFAEPGHGAEVVGSWTGAGSSNPLEALQNARLTPWLLQLLALAILLAWWRGTRFGLPRDTTPEKRHAFVEHIEALGFLYAKSKASRYALANYGAWALARLHERLLPGARTSMSQLAHVLASLTGREETRIVQILIAAKSAQDEAHDTLTTKEHLDTMKELQALLKATGGAR